MVKTIEQLESELARERAQMQRYEQGYEKFAKSANEINNQLAVLKGTAQLAATQPDDENFRELSSVVFSGVSRIQTLLRQAVQAFPGEGEAVVELKRAVQSQQVSILVVDDEAMLRKLLEKMLTRHGYIVQTAGCGADAIRVGQEKEFDVILMDYRLGDMSGLEAFREIRKKQAACRVVFLTGDPNINEIRTAVHNEGAQGFITKPFEVEEINNVIQHLLQRQAA